MAIELKMPALSPTMEEGTLAKWLVKEGDKVKSGQIIAEIETDKATMEFEAVDEGIVGKLLVAEGTATVKVNTPIAVMVDDGESVTDTPAPAGVGMMHRFFFTQPFNAATVFSSDSLSSTLRRRNRRSILLISPEMVLFGPSSTRVSAPIAAILSIVSFQRTGDVICLVSSSRVCSRE